MNDMELRLQKNDTMGVMKDERGIVRGLWFPDEKSARNNTRHRAVLSMLRTDGEIIEESDQIAVYSGGIHVAPAKGIGGFIVTFPSGMGTLDASKPNKAMSFWKKLFGPAPVDTGLKPSPQAAAVVRELEKLRNQSIKPKGFIRYVVLVVSHPVSPTPGQTSAFLNKILPELETLQDGTAKIATLWDTKPISSIDMTAKAVEAFGSSVVNNDIYAYRTLHLGLQGGDAKCLVVYDKTSDNPKLTGRNISPNSAVGDVLAQPAVREAVRKMLADMAKKGPPDEHYFFSITFNTAAPGVRLSERMRTRYPDKMTIVLQHQFWNLVVTDGAFEVGLSFDGVPERVAVPFDAVTEFYDAAVQAACQAIPDGDLGTIKVLLKENPGLVFGKDANGATPLHAAALVGPVATPEFLLARQAVVKLLLAYGADVNATGSHAWTPLHVAAASGHATVAELLVANGANVDARDEWGRTPLYNSACSGHKDVAELLLASKVDVNAKSNQGWTPLYAAAHHGQKDMAKLLRKHGGR